MDIFFTNKKIGNYSDYTPIRILILVFCPRDFRLEREQNPNFNFFEPTCPSPKRSPTFPAHTLQAQPTLGAVGVASHAQRAVNSPLLPLVATGGTTAVCFQVSGRRIRLSSGRWIFTAAHAWGIGSRDSLDKRDRKQMV